MMTTSEFLREVFGEPPNKESQIVVWALQDKASRWCEDVAGAVKAIDAAKNVADVYVAVAFQNMRLAVIESRRREDEKAKRENRPARRMVPRLTRGFNETAAALTGLFADIDIAGPGHKHANLPKTESEALAIVTKTGAPPTIVVSSGGGIHAWWLFQEPYVFENDDDRRKAYELSQAWQRMIQRHAVAAGVGMDSTFDLTRVLRIPGTLNRKYDPPRVCEVIRRGGPRYNPSHLVDLLDPSDFAEAKQRASAEAKASALAKPVEDRPPAERIVLDANANVPIEKFEALMENEAKFKKTWNRQRNDLKDQSPSGYDMALANAAVRAQWSNQEIVNLLIAHRRKHKDELKLDRLDYYEKFTIAAARRSAERSEAVQSVYALTAPTSPDAPREEMTDERKTAILDGISNAFQVRIRKIIRYKQDPPRYRLVTTHGAIELGTVENLIGQVQFRNAVAANDGRLIPPFSKEDWTNFAQALLDVCDTVDTGPESTDEGMMRGWVERYLDDNPPAELTDNSSEQLIANQQPFVKMDVNGRAFIFGPHFREWVFRRDSERLTAKQMGIIMRKIGGEPRSEFFTPTGGKDTTRNVWIVPLPQRGGGDVGGANGHAIIEKVLHDKANEMSERL